MVTNYIPKYKLIAKLLETVRENHQQKNFNYVSLMHWQMKEELQNLKKCIILCFAHKIP